MMHKAAGYRLVTTIVFALIVGAVGLHAQQTVSLLGSTLNEDERLAQFAGWLDTIGLLETLNDENSTYTLFAPTNDAFSVLSDDLLDYLHSQPDILERIVKTHMVDGSFTSEDLDAVGTLQSLAGETLEVKPELHRINGADLVGEAITVENGIIYPIDSLLIPEIELPPIDPFINFDSILTAGSSTVRPLTERVGERFAREGFSGEIVVEETGTNVGLERFCVNAETDIANASRPIRETEIEACRANEREPIGFFVAVDALSVVVSKDNTFIDDLTLEQLARVFTGEYTRWSEVSPDYPDEPILTFSPGADSGTFVYFVESVVVPGLQIERDAAQSALLSSTSIQFSEDDNVLVRGVEGSTVAIGYFGFAYYLANQDRLRVVRINGVEPNEVTAESGEYPLSRPLFIYTSPDVMNNKPQVAEFVNFYINNVQSELGSDEGDIGYFPVSRDILNLDRLEWLAALDAAR